MATFPQVAIPALWAIWLMVWLTASPFTKRTLWREAPWARFVDVVALSLCTLLLAAPRLWPAPLLSRFRSPGMVPPLVGTVLVAAGLAFAIWARLYLGRNWSSRVVLKQDHVLIRSGPYAIVRHPIYAGMLVAFFGTALAIGEWRGPLAFVFALLGFLRRIPAEERRMGKTFDEYEAYRRTTPALIPRLF